MIGTSLVNKLWKMVLYILAGSFCLEKFKNQNHLKGLNQMHAVDGIELFFMTMILVLLFHTRKWFNS